MVNQTATINEINPTNTKKKYWKITIWLAKFLSFKIIGRIIPKSWSEWAKKVLDLDSSDTTTHSAKNQSQNSKKGIKPEIEIENKKSNGLEPKVEVVGDEFIDEEFIDMEGLIILKKEVDELRSKASSQEALQSDIDELKIELTEMRDQKEQLEQIIKEELPELKQATERLKEEFSKECERLKGEIKSLKEDLAKKEGEITGLRKKIEEKDAEISGLKRINEVLDKAKQEMEAAKDKKINELEELIKELTADKDVNTVISERNVVLKARVEELESKVSRLKSDNDAEVERLNGQLAAKGNEVVTLNEKVGSLEREKTALQASNDALTKSLEEKQQELEQAKNTREGLEEKLREKDGLQSEIDKLKARLAKMEELKTELQGEKKENENLSNQLNTVREEKDRLNTQLNNNTQNFKQELERISKEAADLRGENEILVQREHGLKIQTDELEEQLRQKEIQHKAQLEGLRNQLSTAEKKKEELEEQVSELQGQVKTLEEDNAQKWKELSQKGNKSLIDENGELKRLNTSLTTERNDLKVKLNLKSAKVEEQAGIVSSKEEEIKKLKELKKKLGDDLQAKQEELTEQKSKVKQLKSEQKLQPSKVNKEEEKEIEALKKQVTTLEGELQTANGKIKKLEEKNQASQSKDPKPQEQEQAKAPEQDAVSRVSIKSKSGSSKSTLSKIWNSPNKLLKYQSLDDFLSDKNVELKGSFPEFENKHFCHTVIEKAMISLSSENCGKFQSDKLLKLLKSKLKELAKQIIKERVTKVGVNKKNYDDGKHINAALQRVNNDNSKIDSTVERDLQSQLLLSIKECVGKLDYNKKDVERYTLSIIDKFKQRKVGKNDLGELLKDIVVEELVEARMNFFSSEVEELGLVSSIRDKFLSPDQKMCDTISEESNEYQLNSKIMDKYKLRSQTDNTSVSPVNRKQNNSQGFNPLGKLVKVANRTGELMDQKPINR